MLRYGLFGDDRNLRFCALTSVGALFILSKIPEEQTMKKFLAFLFIVAMVCVALCSCGEHVHEFGEWTVTKNPTCAVPGEQERLCACGEKQTQAIPVKDHTVVTDAAVPATCSATGLTEGSHCSVCGAKIVAQNIVPKLDHTPVADPAVPATCSSTGLTDGSHCSVCGTTIVSQNIVSMLAHTYGDVVVKKAPTCSETGINARICTVCGHEDEEVVPTIAHTPVIDAAVPATCAASGLTEGSHCSVCGAVITAQSVVPKKDHTWNAGATTTAPTCTEAGVKTYTCTVCGAKKTESILALGHNTDSTGKCTRCGLYVMNMTSSEKTAAAKVDTMSHSVSEYSDEIRINISFKDSSGYRCQTPTYVDVKIVNSLGVTVYSKTLVQTSAQSYVSIKTSDITTGYSGTGILYYTVYNTGYFTFNQINREVTKLPWTVKVTLPTLPKTINYSYTSGTLVSTCKVTSITYEVSGDDLYIYFAGEKTYDKEGSKYSSSCKVGWKLYDSEGYVVASGTLYTQNICVGEKFRNEKEYAWDCITPGETYRLEIMNIG